MLQEQGSHPQEEETSLKTAVEGIPSGGDGVRACTGQGSGRQEIGEHDERIGVNTVGPLRASVKTTHRRS